MECLHLHIGVLVADATPYALQCGFGLDGFASDHVAELQPTQKYLILSNGHQLGRCLVCEQ